MPWVTDSIGGRYFDGHPEMELMHELEVQERIARRGPGWFSWSLLLTAVLFAGRR
jgi:hypothetical protein